MTAGMVIALMVVGWILLAAELLVIPGFGLIGILGVGSVLAAVGLAFSQMGEAWGGITLAVGVGISGAGAWLLPKTGMGKAMVLQQTQKGGVAVGESPALVGREGEAVTPLRPAGSARIDERVVDVVSDGVYIEAGTRVRVVKIEGRRVLVEPLS